MPKVFFIFPDLKVEQKQDLHTRARGLAAQRDGEVLEHSCLCRAPEPDAARGLGEPPKPGKPKKETAL